MYPKHAVITICGEEPNGSIDLLAKAVGSECLVEQLRQPPSWIDYLQCTEDISGDGKATALMYKRFLDEFGMVSSEVLISGPDDREGNEEVEVNEEDLPEIQRFWKKMIAKHGSEDQYNKNLINGFKHGDSSEIIIVVDKLLTGFDAPRNTVLYLTRTLKDHTLLQAIARVNRLCEGKDFGYIIDYRGVLGNLKKAFDFYNELEEADQQELENSLTNVAEEIEKLPRRHTELLNLFQDIKNKRDEELYELKLGNDELRERFYECLRDYARSLSMALGSLKFMEETPDERVEKYRKDLKFFMQLRASVKRRYAEVVDFKEYEAKIQKLLDTHVATGSVQKVTSLVNIFEKEAFEKELEELEGKSTASKADTIAHRTKKTIKDRMEDDPAFYSKFSKMLEDAIQAFRQRRLADAEYLAKVSEIADAIRTRRGAGLPADLQNHEVAQAFFGIVKEVFANHQASGLDVSALGASAALQIDEIIGVDDTSVRMQDPSIPGKMRTARFWLYRGREDHPYNVFDFTESRGRDGPAGFLSDFHGHAVVDAYGVKDGVYLGKHNQIFAACCNCHARRKFVEAKPNDAVAAAQAIAMYRGLYDVEDRAKEACADERLELRQRESVPLMNELYDWLVEKSSDLRVLPKSSLGKAVRYALNQWDEMSVFLGDGAIPFDNNETESELRSLTIGRQNWLFVGSSRGGEVAAAMYSLVSSAARHNLDVWAYVDDCLRRLAGGSMDYESLLPDVWRASHPESIRVYRDTEKKSRRLTTQQRRVRRREARVA